MNKMVVLAAAAGAVLLAQAAPFKDGDRVVFFGDSITHGGFYGEYVNLFYATRYPERNIWSPTPAGRARRHSRGFGA